jgi:hypothetical protein
MIRLLRFATFSLHALFHTLDRFLHSLLRMLVSSRSANVGKEMQMKLVTERQRVVPIARLVDLLTLKRLCTTAKKKD